MINFLDTMSDFEKQLDRLKAEIAQKTAQYIAEQKNEPTPMPRLENGMIGLAIEHEGDMKIQEWFVVIQETENKFRLLYQRGDYDVLYEDFPEDGFDTNGISDYDDGDFSEIIYLTKCECFEQAQIHYEQDRSIYEVWRKYDKSED
jgi:hypothetical protein